MNKLVLGVVVLLAAASMARCDIAVQWKNQSTMWFDKNNNDEVNGVSGNVAADEYKRLTFSPDPVTTVPGYIQLLWSATDPSGSMDPVWGASLYEGTFSTSDAVGTSYVRPWGTEYLLDSHLTDGLGTTSPNHPGTSQVYNKFDYSGTAVPYLDSVIGQTLGTGFLYSRLFSDQTLVADLPSGSGTRYYQSAAVATKTYNEFDLNTIMSHDSGGGVTPREYNYPVMVPEPSTLALLGLGVVTLALRRRAR